MVVIRPFIEEGYPIIKVGNQVTTFGTNIIRKTTANVPIMYGMDSRMVSRELHSAMDDVM